MPFFKKYQPVRIEDEDDLESAPALPKYTSGEQTPLNADPKIILVVDQKAVKRRRRCGAIIKWIIITWALIAVIHHFVGTGDYRREHRHHHGHIGNHRGKKNHGHHWFEADQVAKAAQEITSSCSNDGKKEVFTFFPDDGVQKFPIADVTSLSVELQRLIADAALSGGDLQSDPSVTVSLSFESDIADAFDAITYAIQLDAGTLSIQAATSETLKPKGCIMAHLDIQLGDAPEADEPAPELSKLYKSFSELSLSFDIGSFSLAGIQSATLDASTSAGAVIVEDSKIEVIVAKISSGAFVGANLESGDADVQIDAGALTLKNHVIGTLSANVHTGAIQIVGGSVEALSAAVGLGRFSIEGASASASTIVDIKVGTGKATVSVDGDQYYGTFEVTSGLGSAKVTDDDTEVPIVIHEPEKRWEAKKKVSGFKGDEGEGKGSIVIEVSLGTAALNFVKLASDV